MPDGAEALDVPDWLWPRLTDEYEDAAEAIAMAWECLVGEFKLDPNRLYATYFAGDEMTWGRDT